MKLPNRSIINHLHSLAKKQAEYEGFDFSLSKKQFGDLIMKNCHYCGAESRNSIYEPSHIIHRVRTDISYAIENCLPCCGICRTMRGYLTDKGFMEKVEQIYRNINNGCDEATRSIYVTERNAGTRGSAILKHIYDMVELDNMQKADIKALLGALVDEHIDEVDLLEETE